MNEKLNHIMEVQKGYAKKALKTLITLWVVFTVFMAAIMVLFAVPGEPEVGLMVFLGVLYLLLGLFFLNGALGAVMASRGKFAPALRNLSVEEQEQVDRDLANGVRIANAVMGKDYLIFEGMLVQVLAYRDIVYIFGSSTTYWGGLVPVATISLINIVNKKRQSFGINMKVKPLLGTNSGDGIDAKGFYVEMHRRAPWAFMGASKENLKLYNSRFKEMVRLAEERCQRITAGENSSLG